MEEFSQEVNYASILVQLFLKPIRILIKSFFFLIYIFFIISRYIILFYVIKLLFLFFMIL